MVPVVVMTTVMFVTVSMRETCNLETGAGGGREQNVLWLEVHVRDVLTTHVLQCRC